ncbi:MAG: hypothetical protein KJ566_01205 [Nanoarchaeota archaeon]|nr:hypothetical protein [Nanoarchaeota archaeon]
MCKTIFSYDKEMYKCIHLMRDLKIPEEKRREYISQGYTFWARFFETTDCLTNIIEKQKGKTKEETIKNIDDYFDKIKISKINALNEIPYQLI